MTLADLRARLVEFENLLDHLLADPEASSFARTRLKGMSHELRLLIADVDLDIRRAARQGAQPVSNDEGRDRGRR